MLFDDVTGAVGYQHRQAEPLARPDLEILVGQRDLHDRADGDAALMPVGMR
jgi:hypothetical protein